MLGRPLLRYDPPIFWSVTFAGRFHQRRLAGRPLQVL